MPQLKLLRASENKEFHWFLMFLCFDLILIDFLPAEEDGLRGANMLQKHMVFNVFRPGRGGPNNKKGLGHKAPAEALVHFLIK